MSIFGMPINIHQNLFVSLMVGDGETWGEMAILDLGGLGTRQGV